MMKKLLLTAALFIVVHAAFAVEFIDGRIRLVLNENSGRFSLYYMTDIAQEEYQPFFLDGDPRTSFLSVMVNNRNYKMGESSVFKTKTGGTPSNPALVFESSFLVVTQNFTFIRTGSSPLTNGVLVTITVENKGEQTVEAGIRLLIDTTLGEKNPPHFNTDRRQITSETLIENSSADRYWVSRNSRLAFMGSIDGQNLTRPDQVHFANWKRLNDAAWKIPYVQGRNFNLLPYSIEDSAVCYYFDPIKIHQGGSRTVSLVLASELSGEDENYTVFTGSTLTDLSALIRESAKMDSDMINSIRTDLITLRDLVTRLDYYASSGVSVSDDELETIGLLISRIKSKYSIP